MSNENERPFESTEETAREAHKNEVRQVSGERFSKAKKRTKQLKGGIQVERESIGEAAGQSATAGRQQNLEHAMHSGLKGLEQAEMI